MSVLHIGQIRSVLESTYLSHLDLKGADQEHHRLSRAVAAMALAERAGITAAAAAKSVTDHSKDGGIDGVAYSAERKTLVMVQSKWTEDTNSSISQGDLLKFMEGVKNLVQNKWDGFGGPIAARRNEISDVLFQPGTKLELVVATTGAGELAEPQIAALGAFCADMNDATEIANTVYLNQPRLYSALAALQGGQIDLDVNLRNWGTYSEAGRTAYYGTASAQEVVGWYKQHREWLFSRNIRGALQESDVNEGILDTAQSDPAQFWFFNNGITVIAQAFEQAPHVNQKSGNFQFLRASVVNGAQTVSSLARAATDHPELLESADVFVRFVTVDDPDGDFARLVTRRTNTQNRVGGREFVALDPEQERLRIEFSVSGFKYAYRAGEVVADPSTGCDMVDATIALACAGDISSAILAKREISRLWDDSEKSPYRALFNSSTSAAYVWAVVQAMRLVDQSLAVEQKKYTQRDQLVTIHGNRLILWALLRALALNNRASVANFDYAIDAKAIEKKVSELTKKLVNIVNADFADSYPQPLFKNLTKCRVIGAALTK